MFLLLVAPICKKLVICEHEGSSEVHNGKLFLPSSIREENLWNYLLKSLLPNSTSYSGLVSSYTKNDICIGFFGENTDVKLRDFLT